MPPEEEKDLRAVLEESYDKEVSEDEPASEPEVEAAPGPDAGGDEPAAQAGEGEQETGEEGAAAEEPEGGGEDAAKFLPPEGEGDQIRDGEQPSGAEAPEEKAPVAWKGAAKQKWAEVPSEVREEVVRREKEVNDVLRESASSRQFQDAFQQTIAPFQQFIAADNSDPLTATRNLMQTAAVLRVGSPQQKAQTVAQIVQQFGVDIETLDSVLAGAPVQPGNGNGQGLPLEAQQYINQQLAPVQQFMTGLQQRAQRQNTRQQSEVSEEIDAFENNSDYPFYEDLREDMALLFARSAERNEKLTLADAYDRAARMNPQVWDIMSKQKAAQQAQRGNKTLEAKKRAAASLRGSAPAPATPQQPTDMRGALEAAWNKQVGG